MRKKTKPWRPYKASCEICGKPGMRMYPKEKYLHTNCKKTRHKIIIKRSIISIKILVDKETEQYLNKVNSCFEVKIRNCLRCGNEFLSEGNHNRVCDNCNLTIEKKAVFIVKIYKNPRLL